MNINTENYEEYFLLYADNELTEAQRRTVEDFVIKHPELKKELDDILNTVQLPEEEISLGDKSFLFRSEEEHFITDKNCEEIFVAYHDGELSNAEKESTEEFLNKNPEHKDTFDWIGKAKLEADTAIVFPDKHLLYRKSAKVRTIVYRAAAAAAITGIISLSIYFLTNSGSGADGPGIVQTEKPSVEQNIVEEKPVLPTEDKKETINEVRREPSLIASAETEQRRVSDIAEASHQTINAVAENEIAEEEDESAMVVINEQLPVEMETVEAITTQSITAQAGIDEESLTRIDETPEIEIIREVINPTYINSILEDDNVDSYVMDIPESRLSKSKIGIFIKKVKRTIDRNNPVNRLFNGGE